MTVIAGNMEVYFFRKSETGKFNLILNEVLNKKMFIFGPELRRGPMLLANPV